MEDHSMPIWLPILAFAVTPGICEELAFRGPILSGFNRSGRHGIAIILSSVAFGAIHMVPLQVFYATLVGMVLGLIAVRSGSLLPGIVFHIIFNSLQVLRSRVDVEVIRSNDFLQTWFEVQPTGGFTYTWPTLVISAVNSAAGLQRLVSSGREPKEVTDNLSNGLVRYPQRQAHPRPSQLTRITHPQKGSTSSALARTACVCRSACRGR